MLRRWHRLLAPFCAAFLLLIGGTGIGIQITDLLDRPAREAQPAGMAEAGRDMSSAKPKSKPKSTQMGQWNHWLKTLHSGEIVGIGGIAFNLLSGFALVYLAGSGLWMYLTMWRRQRR
jgi:uncharacterized iron-regulated membrane protein